MLGFETDEVLEEAKRDLVYPKRINPLTTGPGPVRMAQDVAITSSGLGLTDINYKRNKEEFLVSTCGACRLRRIAFLFLSRSVAVHSESETNRKSNCPYSRRIRLGDNYPIANFNRPLKHTCFGKPGKRIAHRLVDGTRGITEFPSCFLVSRIGITLNNPQ